MSSGRVRWRGCVVPFLSPLPLLRCCASPRVAHELLRLYQHPSFMLLTSLPMVAHADFYADRVQHLHIPVAALEGRLDQLRNRNVARQPCDRGPGVAVARVSERRAPAMSGEVCRGRRWSRARFDVGRGGWAPNKTAPSSQMAVAEVECARIGIRLDKVHLAHTSCFAAVIG